MPDQPNLVRHRYYYFFASKLDLVYISHKLMDYLHCQNVDYLHSLKPWDLWIIEENVHVEIFYQKNAGFRSTAFVKMGFTTSDFVRFSKYSEQLYLQNISRWINLLSPSNHLLLHKKKPCFIIPFLWLSFGIKRTKEAFLFNTNRSDARTNNKCRCSKPIFEEIYTNRLIFSKRRWAESHLFRTTTVSSLVVLLDLKRRVESITEA